MTDASGTRWYSLPEVAEILGIRLRDVRTLLRDNALAASRRGREDGPVLVPADFLLTAEDGAARPGPVPALRGTLIQLQDGGFTVEEAVEWLLTEREELGTTPIAALRARRIHEVRRVAQTVAL
ncbi:Rv2175c family DNA-binding protein [uncultured Georgenia sp.]|uniref:Rv2175c family DNA-binding protein n=1 Tax=uncultured Georgenia sp. TaxID=378209 RepID=UPI002612F5B2|nr:Rv2175c family DNA-binding protein [uncultured Georgenia sp.]HLV05124.1 Rv2175c family DNA-binding protein [Actinomycetaceae bacterium]